MARTTAGVHELAEDWAAAWNARDLDRIIAHYADDVEFEANRVVRRWQSGPKVGRLQKATAIQYRSNRFQ